MLKKTILSGLAGLLVSSLPLMADYSAVGDFPTTPTVINAQNGVWSYGIATTLNPVDFVLDTNATSDYFNNGAAVAGYYTPTGNTSLPTVLKNDTGGTYSYSSITAWPTNVLLLHPGPGGDYSIVRFTAPATATYSITGMFTSLDSGATDDSASITASGVSTSLYSATTTSASTPNAFHLARILRRESLSISRWG